MPNFFDLMNRLKAFVYYDDHGEPHYHICRGRESLAKVRMRDFSVMDGWVENRVVRELRGLHERNLAEVLNRLGKVQRGEPVPGNPINRARSS